MVAKSLAAWEQPRRENLRDLILNRVADGLIKDAKMATPRMMNVNGFEVRAEYQNKDGGMKRISIEHEGVGCEVEVDFTIDHGEDEVRGHRGVRVDSLPNVPAVQLKELARSFVRTADLDDLADIIERQIKG